jgi:hypothetical protein
MLELQQETLPDGVDTAVFTDPVLLDVLKELGAKLPEDRIKVSEIRIASPNARSSWITIAGEVGNSGQLVEVYNDLKNSKLLAFNAEPELSVQGSQTTFTIRADRPVPGVEAEVPAVEAAAAPEAQPESEAPAAPAETPPAEPAPEPAPAAADAPPAPEQPANPTEQP